MILTFVQLLLSPVPRALFGEGSVGVSAPCTPAPPSARPLHHGPDSDIMKLLAEPDWGIDSRAAIPSRSQSLEFLTVYPSEFPDLDAAAEDFEGF